MRRLVVYHCTNYKAEVVVDALIIAANDIAEDVGGGLLCSVEPDAQVVLLADALSVIQPLEKVELHSSLSNINCLGVMF